MKFGWVESSENLLKLLTLNARRQQIYAADRPRDLLGSGNGPGRRRPDPRVPIPRQSRQRRNPVRGARRPRPRPDLRDPLRPDRPVGWPAHGPDRRARLRRGGRPGGDDGSRAPPRHWPRSRERRHHRPAQQPPPDPPAHPHRRHDERPPGHRLHLYGSWRRRAPRRDRVARRRPAPRPTRGPAPRSAPGGGSARDPHSDAIRDARARGGRGPGQCPARRHRHRPRRGDRVRDLGRERVDRRAPRRRTARRRLPARRSRVRARRDRRRRAGRHLTDGRPRQRRRHCCGRPATGPHQQRVEPSADLVVHPDARQGPDRDWRHPGQPAGRAESLRMSTEAERPRVRPAAIVSWLNAGWVERSAIWVVLVALLGVAALCSDAFLQPSYLFNMVRQAAPVGVAAIGVTLVMVMGGVDLSVGAVISLAAVVAAVLMDGQAGNIGYALAATLTIGAAIGFANGVLIAWNRGSPFILTLGTAVAVYGLTQIYSGGTARGIVAPGFREFFNERIGGLVPVLALLFLAAATIAALVQRTTRFGRSLYLVGSNPRAARLAGLRAARLTVTTYTLSGLLAALGGIALLARSGVSSTFAGRGFEFDALAAVVLGGTTFEGGRGGVGGTVAGLLVLFVAFNLVNILGLNYNVQRLVAGVIIIVASAAYTYLTSRRLTESRLWPSHHTSEGAP